MEAAGITTVKSPADMGATVARVIEALTASPGKEDNRWQLKHTLTIIKPDA